MSILNNSLLLGADAGAAGYQISRSLRFNSSDSAFLSRTPASAGNRKTWTWAGWVKRGALGSNNYLFTTTFANANEAGYLYFNGTSNSLTYWDRRASADGAILVTNSVFRDVSAWYHVVLSVDYSNATAANRARLYVNGVEQTYSSNSYPSTTEDSYFNAATAHYISSTSGFIDGYLADIHFIDGQALTPSSFAETNATTGQWVPKAYTGSYGTNGFRLDFSDNSAATATTLGKDRAGSNNFTPNNFQVSNTPYANYATGGTNPKEVFDGNADLNNRNFLTGTQVFEFAYTPGLAYSSKIEIWAYTGNGADGATAYQINNSGSYTNFSADGTWGWLTVATGSGTLTNLKYRGNSNNSGQSFIAAIRIDSTTILIDDASRIDSLVDTPTSYGTDTGAGGEVRGNYATINPLDNGGGLTLSNGNLEAENTAASSKGARCTIKIPSTGKWYFEGTIQTLGGSCALGVATSASANPSLSATGTWHILNYAGSGIQSYPGGRGYTFTTAQVGNVLQVAYDADSGKLWFGVNNTWCDGSSGSTGNPGAGTNPTYTSVSDVFPAVEQYTSKIAINFGQRPFAYTAPSGFKALCDTNLPAPTIAKPSTVMDVVLWSGDGTSNRSITLPGGFSPDFVWTKMRNAANQHLLYDAVRGATLALATDNTNAETTRSTTITSFDSSGFTTGSSADTNGSGNTYVGWCWDAGTSTVTNTSGSIGSQVRANASAGVSIVTYSQGPNNSTVGHGLGVAPHMIIAKSRTSASGRWDVYHRALGREGYIYLDGTQAAGIYPDYWGTSGITSTTFGLSLSGNFNNLGNMVAYCFAPVAGYSAFGSYTGNGSTDGPFVYTGMLSRWIMLKRTDTTGNWTIIDTAREGYNVDNDPLYPNLADAEGTTDLADILSNGFKLRTTDASVNASAGTYVYACFASNPFSYSRAR